MSGRVRIGASQLKVRRGAVFACTWRWPRVTPRREAKPFKSQTTERTTDFETIPIERAIGEKKPGHPKRAIEQKKPRYR